MLPLKHKPLKAAILSGTSRLPVQMVDKDAKTHFHQDYREGHHQTEGVLPFLSFAKPAKRGAHLYQRTETERVAPLVGPAVRKACERGPVTGPFLSAYFMILGLALQHAYERVVEHLQALR
jgi:hypothetical protein